MRVCAPARGVRLGVVDVLLWLVAVMLVVGGVVLLFEDSVILGVVLILAGLAVGPGVISRL